ncbi:radical SAM protein [Ignicoccus pacificus DSM 13166]|uniref:Radical SAM protein n=1 Tax=Ignicoccus pacificus DSM 13166 TaxID=940294 RepID=A0A977PK99_9CREN|nr:radical SAM protein [Ignicoccus pacificus DSM 13166]
MRLEVLREFDPWKGDLCTCPKKYSLQPYTGCSFMCLYCYATAYIGRRPSEPKKRFLERLERDLRKADRERVVNLSTSSDPYPIIEKKYLLTRNAIRLLSLHDFKILITTKGSLVARDKDLLSKSRAAVMITITTLDASLAREIEPGAPSPLERLKALKELSEAGVPVGIRLDPIIPGVNDDSKELEEIVFRAAEAGAKHVVTSTYKAKPDNLKRMTEKFPHLKSLYSKGVKVGRYKYLPKGVREKMLRPVVKAAEEVGMTWAFCREGFPFKAPSCDGSHLIPNRKP